MKTLRGGGWVGGGGRGRKSRRDEQTSSSIRWAVAFKGAACWWRTVFFSLSFERPLNKAFIIMDTCTDDSEVQNERRYFAVIEKLQLFSTGRLYTEPGCGQFVLTRLNFKQFVLTNFVVSSFLLEAFGTGNLTKTMGKWLTFSIEWEFYRPII